MYSVAIILYVAISTSYLNAAGFSVPVISRIESIGGWRAERRRGRSGS